MSTDPGLAAERTTLAWRRNGVSLAAAGLAIVKGLPVGRGVRGRPLLGLLVLLLGLFTFSVGARQVARRSRHAGVGRPTAELDDLWPVAVATFLVALAAAAIVLVR